MVKFFNEIIPELWFIFVGLVIMLFIVVGHTVEMRVEYADAVGYCLAGDAVKCRSYINKQYPDDLKQTKPLLDAYRLKTGKELTFR